MATRGQFSRLLAPPDVTAGVQELQRVYATARASGNDAAVLRHQFYDEALVPLLDRLFGEVKPGDAAVACWLDALEDAKWFASRAAEGSSGGVLALASVGLKAERERVAAAAQAINFLGPLAPSSTSLFSEDRSLPLL